MNTLTQQSELASFDCIRLFCVMSTMSFLFYPVYFCLRVVVLDVVLVRFRRFSKVHWIFSSLRIYFCQGFAITLFNFVLTFDRCIDIQS